MHAFNFLAWKWWFLNSISFSCLKRGYKLTIVHNNTKNNNKLKFDHNNTDNRATTDVSSSTSRQAKSVGTSSSARGHSGPTNLFQRITSLRQSFSERKSSPAARITPHTPATHSGFFQVSLCASQFCLVLWILSVCL